MSNKLKSSLMIIPNKFLTSISGGTDDRRVTPPPAPPPQAPKEDSRLRVEGSGNHQGAGGSVEVDVARTKDTTYTVGGWGDTNNGPQGYFAGFKRKF